MSGAIEDPRLAAGSVGTISSLLDPDGCIFYSKIHHPPEISKDIARQGLARDGTPCCTTKLEGLKESFGLLCLLDRKEKEPPCCGQGRYRKGQEGPRALVSAFREAWELDFLIVHHTLNLPGIVLSYLPIFRHDEMMRGTLSLLPKKKPQPLVL